MNADAPSTTTPRKWLGIAVGVGSGALFALALYLLARSIQDGSGMLLLSVLLIPPAACALAVIVSGIRRDSDGNVIFLAGWVVTALLIGAAIVFHEGAVCLAMAAPIFYPFGILGALAAKSLLRASGKKRLSAAFLVLAPALLMPFERQDSYEAYETSVTTQFEIAAPIDTVWREAIEIREIADDENVWTLTQDVLQIPKPVEARLIEHEGVRVREATWAGGIRFNEVVTEWQEGQTVAWRFDVPEAAANRMLDEHLRLDEGYLQLQSGSYVFEALSSERTRLTLTTRYSARTPLNAYAEAWGRLLLGDIHRNVLSIVRARAEASARSKDATSVE